jgi:SAM-dependent methyltransferase
MRYLLVGYLVTKARLDDASVDLAFSTISFHHWSDQMAGIREIARVLRPGGGFIFADQSWPTWICRLFSGLHGLHPSAPPLSELQKMFEVSGLRILKQTRIFSGFIVMMVGIRNS